MGDNRNLTRRHRLRSFDYTTPGYYFVTICTHERRHLLGRIMDGDCSLSMAGMVVKNTVLDSPTRFHHVLVDSFVVMPNHLHILFYLPIDQPSVSVSDLVRWIKGVSTASYGKGVRDRGWPPYTGHFWQKGFNDQIIRNDQHLYEVQRYIEENPVRWEQDEMCDAEP